jgi:hypothetical protein
VGITAAVATLVGYTTGLLYGFSLRVLYSVHFSGYLLGTTVLIILSIYMGPVDPQVDYHQAIQSILCCAYITTIIVIFISFQRDGKPNCPEDTMQHLNPRRLRLRSFCLRHHESLGDHPEPTQHESQNDPYALLLYTKLNTNFDKMLTTKLR